MLSVVVIDQSSEGVYERRKGDVDKDALNSRLFRLVLPHIAAVR